MESKFITGRVEFEALVEIKAVYSAQFTDKTGKEVTYHRALIPARKGLTEISITEVLFDQINSIIPSEVAVKAIFDANFNKIKFDTL